MPEEKALIVNETFTIVTWVKVDAGNGVRAIFEKIKYLSTNKPRIQLAARNSSFEFIISQTNSDVTLSANITLDWVMIAVASSGNRDTRIFYNSIEAGVDT